MEADRASTAAQDRRCECKPWEQRWKAETYWLCVRCGMPFPEKGVEARKPYPGEVLPDA